MTTNQNLLKMQRQSQMRAINQAKPIPLTKKFDGVTYHLARVHMYKGQADHEAEYVREHGGMARVVKGSIGIGGGRKTYGYRVYTRE